METFQPQNLPPQQPVIIEEHHSHMYRMIIVTVFVLLVGVAGYIFIQRSQNNSEQSQNPPLYPDREAATTQVTQNPESISPVVSAESFKENEPWVKIMTESGKSEYKVGEQIDLVVKGFSNGKSINAYTILVSFDPTMVDVDKKMVQSIPATFQVFAFKEKTYLSITGTKNPSVTTPTVFNQDSLVRIPMTAKKAGTIKFTILQTFEKEQTKLVDGEAQNITPQTQAVQVEIK